MKRRIIIGSSIGAMSTIALLLTPTQLPWWCLALSLAQASTHLACSRDHPLGWTLGLALQPPWATYSILTGQPAFLLTTVMITIGNLLALHRHVLEASGPAPNPRRRRPRRRAE